MVPEPGELHFQVGDDTRLLLQQRQQLLHIALHITALFIHLMQ